MSSTSPILLLAALLLAAGCQNVAKDSYQLLGEIYPEKQRRWLRVFPPQGKRYSKIQLRVYKDMITLEEVRLHLKGRKRSVSPKRIPGSLHPGARISIKLPGGDAEVQRVDLNTWTHGWALIHVLGLPAKPPP